MFIFIDRQAALAINERCSKMETPMPNPILPIFLISATALTACTDAASTHAVQSTDHSAAAASHGSQASGQSIAATVGVPLVVSGAALVVSGAALASPAQMPAHTTTTPNGPPTL